MKKSKSLFQQLAIVTHYSGLALFLVAFGFGKDNWSTSTIILLLIGLGASALGFYLIQIKTGLWRLIHAKSDTLDERQIQVTRESLRISYSIFSIVTLIIFWIVAIFQITGFGPLGVLLPATFVLSAHTLPGSILLWRGEHFFINE